MKNYLLVSILILLVSVISFLLGRYTSDTGRYYFKYDGADSSLFDTRTGDIYFSEDDLHTFIKINYTEFYKKDLEKKKFKQK